MSDSVKTTSSVYDVYKPKWAKVRLVDGGEDSMHLAGEAMLPRLQQQDDTSYMAYLYRTRFLPAFHRAIQGLSGTALRKDPILHIDGIEDYSEVISTDGSSLNAYIKLVIDETLKMGVGGTLVDYPQSTETLTVAQAEALNLRPVLGYYKAESIINWKHRVINNIQKLELVVLMEALSTWVDEFATESSIQYRVLRLDSETGYYTQQIYTSDGGEYTGGEIITPMMNGVPLAEIPFFFHGEYDNPPLYDLVTTNIKHYQLKADHNHALHYIGLPTPIFPGVDPNDPNKPTTIGPSQIVYLSDHRCKPFYLTYAGEGLASIEKELAELKMDMAYLGAQMLAPDTMVAETATKATIRRAGETSSLSNVTENVSVTLSNALKLFAEWTGVEDTSEIEVVLSSDFNPLHLTSQDLLALVNSWISGAISKETLFYNLQQGEIIPGDVQFEDEEEAIENAKGSASSGSTGVDDSTNDTTDDNTDDEA